MMLDDLRRASATIPKLDAILSRILGHATLDETCAWRTGSNCEIDGMDIKINLYSRLDVDITLYLNAPGQRAPWYAQLHEDNEHEGDKRRARIFALKVVNEFGGQADRDHNTPTTLHLVLAPNIDLHIERFPSRVTYKCEKRCVAVLPGGKEILIEDVPLDA